MIDQARVSDRILDEGFGLEIQHNERSDTIEFNQNGTSEFSHYGILGMKWGIRRTPEQLGHRQRKNETPQEYQARMNRESAERTAKIQAKARADSEKRALADKAASEKRRLKSQEKIAKMQLKSQEKERAEIRKAQEKERKRQEAEQSRIREEQAKQRQQDPNTKKSKTEGSVKSMTDQELRDAIQRIRTEKEYLQMTKKPDGLLKKTVKGVGKVGGGVLLQVGKNIAIKQLSDIGNSAADDFLTKKGLKKKTDNKSGKNKSGKDESQYGGVDSNVLKQLLLLEEYNKR